MRTSVSRAPTPAAASQRGGFLLEAMIAILIFSLGVLGLVGLQANAVSFTNDAQYRSEAVWLANSLVAQMWTDERASVIGKYAVGQPGYDNFKDAVDDLLPGAKDIADYPKVTVVAGPTTTSVDVTIEIAWQAPGDVVHRYVQNATVGQNQ